jgi:hypothetical protein
MRELELFGQFLMRLRQERLQQGHARALDPGGALFDIKVCAHEAELCTRIHAALKALALDPGKFIQEFLS